VYQHSPGVEKQVFHRLSTFEEVGYHDEAMLAEAQCKRQDDLEGILENMVGQGNEPNP